MITRIIPTSLFFKMQKIKVYLCYGLLLTFEKKTRISATI